ncbi:uncharacterized protein [Dysidea avara]|uniref:uncharacterized protein isoform X1 n=1 Tax=Dysidea avara TaxID=196820 RepID=UPI003326DBDE
MENQATQGEGEVFHLPPINSTTTVSQKNLSKRLQKLMRDAACPTAQSPPRPAPTKYQPKRWKDLSTTQYNKLTSIEKSRYDAYESPPKHIQELQEAALKRVRAVKQEEKEKVSKNPAISEVIEQEYNSELIGQLRAAEAKERVNNIRYQFRVDKAQEINHLISQQPSAMEAVRLKCFLQPQNPGLTANATVYLNQRQRERCEAILEDEKGLTVTRS